MYRKPKIALKPSVRNIKTILTVDWELELSLDERKNASYYRKQKAAKYPKLILNALKNETTKIFLEGPGYV